MRALSLSVLVIGMVLIGVIAAGAPVARSMVDLTRQPLDVSSSPQWHYGSGQNTTDVEIVYTTDYGVVPEDRGDNVKQGMGILTQTMWINFRDGSEARVGFQLIKIFKEGGLDPTNGNVLNSSRLSHISLMLHSHFLQGGHNGYSCY
jgi:hypothetical protein